ncbi:hypothetical protein B7H23_03380 [Notoacmeibacter marinus]|uniref:Uncharacterized protein n=1 Tax=Notoacmeibacter marinus TaxID=1876515 RepID=A0A231V1R9_9HYPH|nr:hypothetical protein [Notoacmeibacter marinus]OXT01991.1 hypothetical protein B7H23_03380 [Notoacmeibacter marinus]
MMADNDRNAHDEARNSFTGRTLTDSQFEEAWLVSQIIEREIHKTGSFREPLTDYAHAFSRSERFDAVRGETIIRDIFKARTGETMNQLRETLLQREVHSTEAMENDALEQARSVTERIRQGDTMPFYRAYDLAAVEMANEYGITEQGAKSLMKETYRLSEGRDLYEVGKEMEAEYHTPVREAERAERAIVAEQKRSNRTPEQ